MFMRRSFSTLSSPFKMSTYTTDKASPFTRAVVRAMRRLYVLSHCFSFPFWVCLFGWVKKVKADDVVLFTFRYPEELADSSFDNTGCELHL